MPTNGQKQADGSKKMLCQPRFTAAEPKFATVLVGPRKTRFVVHEQLLTHHSEFFRAALTGSFREATNKTVELPEAGPETFECFVHWLYNQRFPDAKMGDNEELVKMWGTDEDGEVLSNSLMHMCVFGHTHMIPKLPMEALDCFYHHLRKQDTLLPDDADIKYVYDSLPHDAPLSRLLVDVIVRYYIEDEAAGNRQWFLVDGTIDWPKDFLLSLAHQAFKVIGGIRYKGKKMRDFELNLCDYHEHETDEERTKCEESRDEK